MSLPRACRLSLGLLLFLRATEATLSVQVPERPIRARPGTDVQLPCHITHTSGPLDLSRLAVMWRAGSKTIAKYEDRKFDPKRPGVTMADEQLVTGNATLQIQRVEDQDTNIYTCFVIYVPDQESGNVDLRVEVPPQVTLGSTTVQLGRPSGVRCAVTGFYPSNLSVTWLRDNRMVKGPESPTAQLDATGLFNAESVLELTPQIADADATISCRVDHRALAQTLSEDCRLRVQAPPVLQIITHPPGTKFTAAECLVSGFYPQEINIQWWKNGAPQRKIHSQLERMPNGSFSAESVIILREDVAEASYVCRVEHESLSGPLEETIQWYPAGGVICPTTRSCQDSGRQQTSPSSCPTGVFPSSSVPGACRLQDHWWLGLTGVIVGLLIGIAGIIFYSKHRANKKRKKITTPLAESEKPNDPSVSML